MNRWWLGVSLLGVGGVLWAGCGESVTANGEAAGKPCRLPSDCAVNEVCENGECQPECREDRDCPTGEVCWPDVGCWPEGETPPQPGPPRDVEFDPTLGLNITFLGCELDIDCDAGFECRGSTCVEVTPGAECDWGNSPAMVARNLLRYDGFAGFNQRQNERVACAFEQVGPLSWASHILTYASGTLRSVEMLTDNSDDACNGISMRADESFLVLSLGVDSKAALHILADGNIFSRSTIDNDASRNTSYDHFTLIPGNGEFLLAWHQAGGEAFVTMGDSRWLTPMAFPPGRPSIAAPPAPDDWIVTTTSMDGIVLGNLSSEAIEDAINMDHLGLEVHSRGGGVVGWFSVDTSGGVFYSVGSPQAGWQTERIEQTNTGFPRNSSARATFLDDLPISVASHPVSGEPHLVYQGIDGKTRSFARRANGIWQTWITTPTTAVHSEIAALGSRWVGCGRPAVDINPGFEPGWTVLEAR